jgi:hypothetical protein
MLTDPPSCQVNYFILREYAFRFGITVLRWWHHEAWGDPVSDINCEMR